MITFSENMPWMPHRFVLTYHLGVSKVFLVQHIAEVSGEESGLRGRECRLVMSAPESGWETEVSECGCAILI